MNVMKLPNFRGLGRVVGKNVQMGKRSVKK